MSEITFNFEEYTYILINNVYGGYNLSEEAIQLYNQKSRDIKIRSNDPDKQDNEPKENKYDLFIERHDPLLIEVFNELGSEKCSGQHCRLKMVRIPKKYEDYYRINEYDGKEGISIKQHEYLLDNIKRVVDAAPPDDERIQEIREILKDFHKSIF
jgi:hypothetical protein